MITCGWETILCPGLQASSLTEVDCLIARYPQRLLEPARRDGCNTRVLTEFPLLRITVSCNYDL